MSAPMVARGARAPVAIVGAGLAGLTAAVALRRRGVPVTLYEAGEQVSGLAASHRDSDGYTYDMGAHFITNRLAAALGVGARCRVVRHYGEVVRLADRDYGYPFGLARVPRFTRAALRARLRRRRDTPAESAAEWFRDEYGDALANEVALPLLEAWSGAPATRLARAVGDKLAHGAAATMALKTAGRLTQRAVAIGYSHEMPEGPQVWHVYPDGGVSLLCRQLADEVGDAIRLRSPVEAIVVEQGRAVAVQAGGRVDEASAVVSTAPVFALARLARGTDALQSFAAVRYRPMVFVNLRLRGRGLLSDTVVWTPEPDYPFFRLTETTRSMPWLAPPGNTLITVDIGAEVGDAVWRMSDGELGEWCLEPLARIIPDVRARYHGCRVLRTPIAYPVYLLEYEAARRRLGESLDIAGLHSIGRNGEFAHILMEDVYWRTQRHARRVATELAEGGVREPT
ncbi:MAG TPA: FAD-dependent oxidoreductase [Gemmatimonadaceae bacterium]|nr:FAD-dependent oxidoreductase [Gemmatimonadaceae bacterium]